MALLKAENRFNGLHGAIEDFAAASETVKTVAGRQAEAYRTFACLVSGGRKDLKHPLTAVAEILLLDTVRLVR